MKILNRAVSQIKVPDQAVHAKALNRLAEQARPAGSLGLLDAATRVMADIKTWDEVNIINAQE